MSYADTAHDRYLEQMENEFLAEISEEEDDTRYDRVVDELIDAGEYREGETYMHGALRRARNKEEQ